MGKVEQVCSFSCLKGEGAACAVCWNCWSSFAAAGWRRRALLVADACSQCMEVAEMKDDG
jgi:hypothetical protein